MSGLKKIAGHLPVPMFLWIVGILTLDCLTPLGIADGMLYGPVVALTMPYGKGRVTLLCAVLCTLAVLVGAWASPDHGVAWWAPLVNRVYSIVVVWLSYFLVVARFADKRAIAQLQQMITMSAWNKQVQYAGEWISVEQYLAKEFGVTVTHGVDPESAAKILEGSVDDEQTKSAPSRNTNPPM